ncbi:MAG: hypothetical protein KA368_01965, partial [Acidobacteria bacterium]|nr:hypothetical protein [Acidobacteriota bacterium]
FTFPKETVNSRVLCLKRNTPLFRLKAGLRTLSGTAIALFSLPEYNPLTVFQILNFKELPRNDLEPGLRPV